MMQHWFRDYESLESWKSEYLSDYYIIRPVKGVVCSDAQNHSLFCILVQNTTRLYGKARAVWMARRPQGCCQRRGTRQWGNHAGYLGSNFCRGGATRVRYRSTDSQKKSNATSPTGDTRREANMTTTNQFISTLVFKCTLVWLLRRRTSFSCPVSDSSVLFFSILVVNVHNGRFLIVQRCGPLTPCFVIKPWILYKSFFTSP